MTAQGSPPKAVATVNWTKFIVRMALVSSLFPLVLFLAAGRLDWGMGWLYVVLTISVTAISRYLMIRRNPELLEERTSALSREDTKAWDKILAPVMAFSPLLQILVTGLDFRIDGSSTFALWLQVLGIVVMLAGYALATWAMLANAFFSSTVRMQTDRGQYVVTDGPYRLVRHPSYLGLLVGSLGTSLMLSSLWSLLPVALMMIVIVIRTALEDAVLQDELPGYRDYAQQTRYRLIPGLW